MFINIPTLYSSKVPEYFTCKLRKSFVFSAVYKYSVLIIDNMELQACIILAMTESLLLQLY